MKAGQIYFNAAGFKTESACGICGRGQDALRPRRGRSAHVIFEANDAQFCFGFDPKLPDRSHTSGVKWKSGNVRICFQACITCLKKISDRVDRAVEELESIS